MSAFVAFGAVLSISLKDKVFKFYESQTGFFPITGYLPPWDLLHIFEWPIMHSPIKFYIHMGGEGCDGCRCCGMQFTPHSSSSLKLEHPFLFFHCSEKFFSRGELNLISSQCCKEWASGSTLTHKKSKSCTLTQLLLLWPGTTTHITQ